MKEGWEYKKIGAVCDIYQPKTISKKDFVDNGEYSVYGANGIIGSYDHYNHKESEVLLGCRGSVGTVTISKPYSWINGNAMVIRPRSSDMLPTFLAYQLKNIDLSKVITGIAQPQITRQSLAPIMIAIPSLTEQQHIVKELDLLSSIIEKKKAQLNELDNLAQSLFYEMFGDPVNNEKSWELSSLKMMGEIGRGVSKHRPRNAPELLGGTMPLIQTGDVANAEMYIRAYNSTYSDLGVSQSKIWKSGTLCITIAATIGKCAILGFDACFPDSVVGFTVNKSICNNEYVYFIFRRLQAILEENAPAVAQKNINLKVLSDLDIPLPPLELQNQFAKKVQAIEHQKELIRQSIKEVETLFNSRMDYYFN